MTAYTPSFLFDFTFFYTFPGLDNAQLLFIGSVVLLFNLFLHLRLSKKRLFFSFPLTLFLLGGIGLRVATSPFSLTYLAHYAIFALLLLVLIVDHRIYLYIPVSFEIPQGRIRTQIEKVSLPTLGRSHPQPVRASKASMVDSILKQRLSSFSNIFSHLLNGFKQIMSAKFHLGSAQPASASISQGGQLQSPVYNKAAEKTSVDDSSIVHPLEHRADDISTTKELLGGIETQSLDHLDSKIKQTKLEDDSFLDSFFSTPSATPTQPINFEQSDIESFIHKLDECAVVISRGVVKAVNDKFSSLINKPRSDIVNHDFVHFLAPEAFNDFKLHCSQRLAGESSQSFPVVLLTKKFKKIPMRAIVRSMSIHGRQVEITIFKNNNT